jgi:hypothetical protein
MMAAKKSITPLRYTLTLQFTPAQRRRLEAVKAATRSKDADVHTFATDILLGMVDAEKVPHHLKLWAAQQELRDRKRGRGVDLIHSLARG